ncbi:S1C family serine protease [Paenibacillus protaetiae]|uniref:Trypsin-like serine protease n=1 Tax=Paenibacillus protaetiae TaxID=2509456 RepID=A0A4P6EYT0_9BACL|nr:trypsin-like peptidase domain-containing protein [Paenibacillus protaetiae]QAY67905.1 trypsin-like serine protease [Paenibacillus protaetiae]
MTEHNGNYKDDYTSAAQHNRAFEEERQPAGYRYEDENRHFITAYENELSRFNGQAERKEKKRRRPALAMFSAFMVGAVAVGGLMFGSDRLGLFTGGAGSAPAVSMAGQSSGLTTASDKSVEANISDIYEAASPAVVKIENYGESQQQSMNDYFSPFFGDDGRHGGSSRGDGHNRQQSDSSQGQDEDSSNLVLTGEGSGFFFEKSGYLLTNEHVIDGAKQLKVTVQGYDEPFTAKVVGSDKNLDLAVLKVDGSKPFSTLELGDSNTAPIGDWVIAIGNPYGFDHTMTVGVLSAKERPITVTGEDGEDHQYEHLLQTDASINPGNSGGPLLDASGKVIGINTAVNSEAQGIGFAIPTSTIEGALKTMMSGSL